MKQTIVIALIVLLALCSFATARRHSRRNVLLAFKNVGLSCRDQAEKRYNDGRISCTAIKLSCDAITKTKSCLGKTGTDKKNCEANNAAKLKERDQCYKEDGVNSCSRQVSDAFTREVADCEKKGQA
jgi:hypothetical protein